MEMPVKPTAQIGQVQAERLRHKLEADRESYRAKVAIILSDLSPEQRRRVEQTLRRTELGYWLLIDAMQSGSPNVHPYLIQYRIIKTPHKGSSR